MLLEFEDQKIFIAKIVCEYFILVIPSLFLMNSQIDKSHQIKMFEINNQQYLVVHNI